MGSSDAGLAIHVTKFITNNGETAFSETPGERVKKILTKSRGYSQQVKDIAKSTYTMDIKKKEGMTIVPASVVALRKDVTAYKPQ